MKRIIIWFLLIQTLPIYGVSITVYNTMLWTPNVTWDFVEAHTTRTIPPATESSMGKTTVEDWRLHKGFSKVHITGARIGDVWGKNPETGDDLEFTPAMFNAKNEIWGIKPNLYRAPLGQIVYHHFQLSIIPKRNPKDSNNWWPSFVITRIDRDVFAPLIKAFAPLKKFFDNITQHTPLAIKVLDALNKKQPLTGYQLKEIPEYAPQADLSTATAFTVAQERATLIKARDAIPEHDVEVRLPYDEEIQILDAIIKYSPIVYLHPREQAGPIAPADFFTGPTTMVRENINHKHDPVVLARGSVTSKKLAELTQKNPAMQYYIWHGKQENPLQYDKRIFYGSNPARYPEGIPTHVITFYDDNNKKRYLETQVSTIIDQTKAIRDIIIAKQNTHDNKKNNDLLMQEKELVSQWQKTINDTLKELASSPIWQVALRDSVGETPFETSLGHLRKLLKRVHDDAAMAQKDFFYIQWLFLYGYNAPYTISIPLGTIFQGDYIDIQNAHEGDLEHITMKVNAASGTLNSIEFGAHGSAEGMWLYPPGTTDNPLKEFNVDDGHPIVFVALGGHGNYPREGVYTRVYGLANDITAKGNRWPMTENNIYRTVPPTSTGFNPAIHSANLDTFGYLYFRGFLGPRGVNSPMLQSWFGNVKHIKTPSETRNPIQVHQNHYCPAKKYHPADPRCIQEKGKSSPPPGKVRPPIIKFLQDIDII